METRFTRADDAASHYNSEADSPVCDGVPALRLYRKPTLAAFRVWVLMALLLLFVPAALSACGGDSDAPGYRLAAPARLEAKPPDLPPIRLPQDEAPHQDLTEWWYYTGHLSSGGRRYGFELVFFQSARGRYPTGYAAHFAITDIARGRFAYDQRTYVGAQPGKGYNLGVGEWRMGGLNGKDRLRARMKGYAIDLALTATKPVVLQEGDGTISFGPAGDSYYYSRTRMAVQGTLVDHAKRLPVTGRAWMDHQWGTYISVAGGGWDWFSVQLDDGADLTLNIVRNAEGKKVLTYGTYVEPDGTAGHLGREEFTARATGRWTSPRTGATYPSGWRVDVPGTNLRLMLKPVLRDQELDTRKSAGVAYWEGAVDITGVRSGKPVRGEGYVELTGYGSPDR